MSLGLPNEQLLPLEPLDVPKSHDFKDITSSDAVTLFVSRAQTVKRTFALNPDDAQAIFSIVTQLDGMPLAIELAAARVRMLSPKALAKRLNRRFQVLRRARRKGPAQRSRHLTLRGTLDDSWELLAPWEPMMYLTPTNSWPGERSEFPPRRCFVAVKRRVVRVS